MSASAFPQAQPTTKNKILSAALIYAAKGAKVLPCKMDKALRLKAVSIARLEMPIKFDGGSRMPSINSRLPVSSVALWLSMLMT